MCPVTCFLQEGGNRAIVSAVCMRETDSRNVRAHRHFRRRNILRHRHETQPHAEKKGTGSILFGTDVAFGMPRACTVECYALRYMKRAPALLFLLHQCGLVPALVEQKTRGVLGGGSGRVAPNVTIHGASPWHSENLGYCEYRAEHYRTCPLFRPVVVLNHKRASLPCTVPFASQDSLRSSWH